MNEMVADTEKFTFMGFVFDQRPLKSPYISDSRNYSNAYDKVLLKNGFLKELNSLTSLNPTKYLLQ